MSGDHIDYAKLGAEVAKHLEVQCKMGWKAEDIATLSELAASIRNAKRTAASALIYTIMVVLLGVLLAGIGVKLKALQ